jgi:hypothetical protein
MISQTPSLPPRRHSEDSRGKRFDRADRNKDGRDQLSTSCLQPRRKAFAKLDKNGDGKLSFEEWAVTTIDKFNGADANRDGRLTRAEYATTAPKPRKKPACKC